MGGLNKELENVLDWVWQERTNILNAAPVPHAHGTESYRYDRNPFENPGVRIINEQMGAVEFAETDYQQANDFNASKVQSYLNGTLAVGQMLGLANVQIRYISQSANLHNEFNVDLHAISIIAKSQLRLRDAYVCYRKSDRAVGGQIFINLAPMTRIMACYNFLPTIWSEPGLVCARISGPWSDRVDSLVIEFTDQAAKGRLEAKLRQWAAANPSYLRNEKRKLTEPFHPDIRGMSTGMGPPDVLTRRVTGGYQRDRAAQTYGIYRAQLIFMALERTERPTKATLKARSFIWNTKSLYRFKKRTKNYFEKAGIDPKKPWTMSPNIRPTAPGMNEFGLELNAQGLDRQSRRLKYVTNFEPFDPEASRKRRGVPKGVRASTQAATPQNTPAPSRTWNYSPPAEPNRFANMPKHTPPQNLPGDSKPLRTITARSHRGYILPGLKD